MTRLWVMVHPLPHLCSNFLWRYRICLETVLLHMTNLDYERSMVFHISSAHLSGGWPASKTMVKFVSALHCSQVYPIQTECPDLCYPNNTFRSISLFNDRLQILSIEEISVL